MQLDKNIEIINKTPMDLPHIAVLDGWRGVSIAMVLAAHLLPLGPSRFKFNDTAGIFGMVLFFVLSGFLITTFLMRDQNIAIFLIRRFFRVIPLAWLYLFISLILSEASLASWYSHFLFYANMPPKDLLPLTDHMWSLCVEVQFYISVALLVSILTKRGLYILPGLCIFFTGLRVWDGIHAASITYYRIDEILSGCMLALIYKKYTMNNIKHNFDSRFQWFFIALLIYSCSPFSGWLNYFRPYIAAILIGATILRPDTSLVKLLKKKGFIWLAGISFSLYVIHPMLAHSWLGSGDVILKYIKRPLLFSVLFLLAILSTRYFESWFIDLGRKLSKRFIVSNY